MPLKYVIISEILISPVIIIPLISLLTPYNLMENSLIIVLLLDVLPPFVALIISIGIGTILLYDELGGGNGVFFFTHTGILYQYAWINSPYNQVPNDLKKLRVIPCNFI